MFREFLPDSSVQTFLQLPHISHISGQMLSPCDSHKPHWTYCLPPTSPSTSQTHSQSGPLQWQSCCLEHLSVYLPDSLSTFRSVLSSPLLYETPSTPISTTLLRVAKLSLQAFSLSNVINTTLPPTPNNTAFYNPYHLLVYQVYGWCLTLTKM